MPFEWPAPVPTVVTARVEASEFALPSSGLRLLVRLLLPSRALFADLFELWRLCFNSSLMATPRGPEVAVALDSSRGGLGGAEVRVLSSSFDGESDLVGSGSFRWSDSISWGADIGSARDSTEGVGSWLWVSPESPLCREGRRVLGSCETFVNFSTCAE